MLLSIVLAVLSLEESIYVCACNNTIRRMKEWRRVKSWLNEPDTKPEAQGAQETDARVIRIRENGYKGAGFYGKVLRAGEERGREAKLLQGRRTRYRGMIAVLNSDKSSPRNGNWSGVPETTFLTKRGVSARNRRATSPSPPSICTFHTSNLKM